MAVVGRLNSFKLLKRNPPSILCQVNIILSFIISFRNVTIIAILIGPIFHVNNLQKSSGGFISYILGNIPFRIIIDGAKLHACFWRTDSLEYKKEIYILTIFLSIFLSGCYHYLKKSI